MEKTLIVHYNNEPIYPIKLSNSFHNLLDNLKELNLVKRRVMVITDSNVSQYYLDEVKNIISQIAYKVEEIIIKAGETSKTLDTVNLCYEELIKHKFDRNDLLIALGGGVVGDLTGYVAATYLRGIRFVQIPTSLLAMVDSSIGGKTGVDFKAYKNMVGAFYQPQLVYINLSTLNTLNSSEFNSGMSEIIKHGLIRDASYYQWLKDHTNSILNKNIEILSEMIYRSCVIKKEVVEEDPKEAGIRALLNFGHTIGHSVERLMNFSLLHGECVAIGIVAASFISLKRGSISLDEYNDIISVLKTFQQPINIQGLSINEIIETTKLDKKMDANQIKFILLKEIGHAYVDVTVNEIELRDSIENLLYNS